MAPTTYTDVLIRNVRAARSRVGLDQADISARMRELGFATWHRQTMGKVERAERQLSAAELAGLALALETTISRLAAPLEEDGEVELQEGGPAVDVITLRLMAAGKIAPGAVAWDGNKPASRPDVSPAFRDAVREGRRQIAADDLEEE